MMKHPKSHGVAMLPAVMVLGVMSLAIAIGITSIALTESFTSQGGLQSNKALFYAESGIRDALIRIARNKTYLCATADCYAIDFTANGCSTGNDCAKVTVTGSDTAKVVTSKGIMQSSSRTLEARLNLNGDGSIIGAGILTELSTATINAGANPVGITVSPDGASVYAALFNAQSIAEFSRDPNTGLLTPLSPSTITAGNCATKVIVSPDGTSAYSNATCSFGGLELFQYSRNPSTGTLTSLGTITVGGSTNGIDISPDGNFVYVTSGQNIHGFSRDPSTGLLSPLVPASITGPGTLYTLAVSSDGTSLYATDGTNNTILMYSRDLITGLLTPLSPTSSVSTGIDPESLVVSRDGFSVYEGPWTGTIYQYGRDTATGLLIPLTPPFVPAGVGGGANTPGIAISPDGASFYVANSGADAVSMYSRDTIRGTLTLLATPTIGTGVSPNGITVSPDGTSVYVTNSTDNTISMFSRSKGVSWSEVTN